MAVLLGWRVIRFLSQHVLTRTEIFPIILFDDRAREALFDLRKRRIQNPFPIPVSPASTLLLESRGGAISLTFYLVSLNLYGHSKYRHYCAR